jgi:hypothetical protein
VPEELLECEHMVPHRQRYAEEQRGPLIEATQKGVSQLGREHGLQAPNA